jgi:hypothetical protein
MHIETNFHFNFCLFALFSFERTNLHTIKSVKGLPRGKKYLLKKLRDLSVGLRYMCWSLQVFVAQAHHYIVHQWKMFLTCRMSVPWYLVWDYPWEKQGNSADYQVHYPVHLEQNLSMQEKLRKESFRWPTNHEIKYQHQAKFIIWTKSQQART